MIRFVTIELFLPAVASTSGRASAPRIYGFPQIAAFVPIAASARISLSDEMPPDAVTPRPAPPRQRLIHGQVRALHRAVPGDIGVYHVPHARFIYPPAKVHALRAAHGQPAVGGHKTVLRVHAHGDFFSVFVHHALQNANRAVRRCPGSHVPRPAPDTRAPAPRRECRRPPPQKMPVAAIMADTASKLESTPSSRRPGPQRAGTSPPAPQSRGGGGRVLPVHLHFSIVSCVRRTTCLSFRSIAGNICMAASSFLRPGGAHAARGPVSVFFPVTAPQKPAGCAGRLLRFFSG